MSNNQTEVACSLDADALGRRRTELRNGLLARVVDSHAIDPAAVSQSVGSDGSAGGLTGFALALPANEATRRELEELIEFESRCCGFAKYSIRPEPARSLLWLEVVGPPGTRELFERLAAAPDRTNKLGRSGATAAGAAALAMIACASPALPIVLGAFGLGAHFPQVATWIDTLAPALLLLGLGVVGWAALSRFRRRAGIAERL
jgi:hypothetical protein